MGEIISIVHRYKDKKNREYDPILEQKIEVLKDWFASQWPEAELKVQFHFSRVVGEELMIKRAIKYKQRQTRHIIESTTGLHRRIWTSPFLMEQFLMGFVQDQMKQISGVMCLRNNEYNYRNKITDAE